MCHQAMSINFNRNHSQVKYEEIIGASSFEEVDKNLFKNHTLTQDEVDLLKGTAKEDAINFFYNGIISFSDGINNILRRHFSWATVQLYYSIYYFIRSSLASKNIILLRNKSMYRLIIRENEKPFSTTNRKYNTTHEGTINHHRDLFHLSDQLLSNNIDNMDAYEWMMNAREIVNYRCASFLEPSYLEIWNNFAESLDDNSFFDLIATIHNDNDFILCFQEEYAVVAIPYKRLQLTLQDLKDSNILQMINSDRINYLKKSIQYETYDMNEIISILS